MNWRGQPATSHGGVVNLIRPGAWSLHGMRHMRHAYGRSGVTDRLGRDEATHPNAPGSETYFETGGTGARLAVIRTSILSKRGPAESRSALDLASPDGIPD